MCWPRLSPQAFLRPSEAMNFSDALEQIFTELRQARSRLDPAAAERLIQELQTAPRIFGFGAGRSGFILRTFCMRLMHLGLTIYYVGETITPRIQPQDLLLVISGSGETSQTVELVRQARARGARTVALTAHPQSAIGRQADLTILVPGTTKLSRPEELESLQCPGSLFEQVAFLFLESIILMLYQQRLGRNREKILARHTDLE